LGQRARQLAKATGYPAQLPSRPAWRSCSSLPSRKYAPWLKALVGHKLRLPRLFPAGVWKRSRIIAYRQPITRRRWSRCRGVSVDGVMQTLVERGLVEQLGRAEGGGPADDVWDYRPVSSSTLACAAWKICSAADELRRIVIQKAGSRWSRLTPAWPPWRRNRLALPTEEPKPGPSESRREPPARRTGDQKSRQTEPVPQAIGWL